MGRIPIPFMQRWTTTDLAIISQVINFNLYSALFQELWAGNNVLLLNSNYNNAIIIASHLADTYFGNKNTEFSGIHFQRT